MVKLSFQNDLLDESVHFEWLDDADLGHLWRFEGRVSNHDDRLVGHGAVTRHSNHICGQLVNVDLQQHAFIVIQIGIVCTC